MKTLADLWRRLRQFCKELKAALRKLFTGKKSTVIDAEVIEEEETVDKDGNVIKKTTYKRDSTPTWKDLLHKAGRKIKMAISDAIEDPAAAIRKLSFAGLGTYFSLSGINAIRRGIIDPIMKAKDSYDKKRTIWDNRAHNYYSLRRPLKNWESNYVNMEVARKRDMGDVLKELGVLA